MGALLKGKATICIVNYRTLQHTQICLRGVRRFTSHPHEIIVVDNDSQDESLEYLRSLKWIRLLERHNANDKSGGDAHGTAIDMALAHCRTEFFVVMHSDTFLLRAGWLAELVGYLDDGAVCVGSGKLEMRPRWQQWLRKVTDYKMLIRNLRGRKYPEGKYRYYNRTICCVYRTETLLREKLTFMMGRDQGYPPGQKLYFALLDGGYKTVELSPSTMGRYMVHLAHATEPPVVHDRAKKKRTDRKKQRRLGRIMDMNVIQQLLHDESLDQVGPSGRPGNGIIEIRAVTADQPRNISDDSLTAGSAE